MGDCADPKDGLSFTSFGDEDPSTFDELLLEEIPVSEFIMQDLVASADVDSCTPSQSEEAEAMTGSSRGQNQLSCFSTYDTQIDSNLCFEEDSSESSPGSHKKKCSSRKDRTPDTMLAILEKHRHSERIRHHTLNERLKVICKLVPGSADDGRETKVVMMQRVISYIAYLENTIEFLSSRLDVQPHRNWLLLTSNSKDYLGRFYDELGIEEEMAAAILPLEETMNRRSCITRAVSARRMKVSSPTVDSTTDSVVPDVLTSGEGDGGVLSQDSGVPSSSTAGDEDHTLHPWSITADQGVGEWTSAGHQADVSSGDLEAFFSSAVDEGISAVFEIPSSTFESPPRVGVTPISCDTAYRKRRQESMHRASVGATADSVLTHSQHLSQALHPVHKALECKQYVARCKAQSYAHKNKRKQYSPKRSVDAEEDWLEDATVRYQDVAANIECETSTVQVQVSSETGLRDVVQVFPYNIRCNHRHIPHRRMYFTRSAMNDCPLVRIIKPDPRPARIAAYSQEEKPPARMDLRKTSWMNGFMMFSRLNRRKYIQAHPGVHTSHISKIMGHAWRTMSPEEQAPYKEKAKLCAQELYRTYTSTPDFHSAMPSSATAPAVSTTTSNTTTSPDSMATTDRFTPISSDREVF